MNLQNICKYYQKAIITFGIRGGNKIFFAWLSQRIYLSHTKNIFTVNVPRFNNSILYLRKNTTDIFLALELLCPDGEYDFLLHHPYIELLKKGTVIVDAGANIGLFSLICQAANPKAKCICIEPENENYSLLLQNTGGGMFPAIKTVFGIKKPSFL